MPKPLRRALRISRFEGLAVSLLGIGALAPALGCTRTTVIRAEDLPGVLAQHASGGKKLRVADRDGDVERVGRDFEIHIEPREGRIFMMPPVEGAAPPTVAVSVDNRRAYRRGQRVDAELEMPVRAQIVGPDLVVTHVPLTTSWPSPLAEPVTVAFPLTEIEEVRLEESDPAATVGLTVGIVLGAAAAFGLTVLALAPGLGAGAAF